MTTTHRGTAERLRASRAALRRWLLSISLLQLVGWAVGVFLLLAALDYLLRLPAWIRWTHFTIGVGALVWAWRTRVRPASAFRPSLSDLALEIERRRPEFRDRLASSVELDELASQSAGVEGELARLASARSGPPAGNLLDGLFDRTLLVRTAIAVVVIVGSGIAAGVLRPAESGTAAIRTAAPWSSTAWPKRTGVVDVTGVTLHPRREAMPLRAALTHSNHAPDETDVAVRTRVYEGGVVVRRARLLASWQQREIALGDQLGEGRGGELFEVLADTDGDMIEYRFETLDDATEWTRVELVERPTVLAATAEIRRPAYLISASPDDEPDALMVDLGQGSDERAAAPPSLAGSTVELTLALNKSVEPRSSEEGWVEETFGPHAGSASVLASEDNTTWTVSFSLEDTRVLRVSLRDHRGVESAESSVFRFPAQRDQAPSVVVIEPAFDDTALPQATVRLAANATDDVALAALWSSAQRYEPEGAEPSGNGGAMAAAGEEMVLERAGVSAGELRGEVASELSLADFEARPGDEVRLWATAIDVYAYETGLREPTRSGVRRIFIVSEDEFVEDIRGALTGVRRESIRLFEAQRELSSRTQRGEADLENVRREQDALSRDIERQSERLSSLRDRISSNGLEDDALEGLTRDAQRLAESAEDAARAASDAAQRDDADSPEDVGRSQERALDDLGELIALLDSGEDAWTARRNLERLLREQLENLEATRELGQETAGLSADELRPEQQDELERIAQRQSELAEQSRSAQESLRETEQSLEESDPATAAALEQAAESLEQADVTRRMEEAAQQAQQNRTSRSAALQQEAAEQLQEALEELDNAERARDEQLRRMAQNLVDTIKALVASQQNELARLERDEPRLDAAMIALHTRTIAAAETALGERELRGAARPLEDAAASQLDAIAALRAADLDAGGARAAETESLSRLQDALEEAERLQQQIEEEATDRQREEIKEAYRQALAQQTELRDRTRTAVPDGEPDRRARAALRRLSGEQDDLAGVVSDLFSKTQELDDAVVFKFAHTRLDEALARSVDSLRDADGDEALHSQARAIVLLRSLVEALDEDQPDDDEPFDDGGGGGGGGQEGGPPELIPGGAQLKLLRAIQGDLLDRTRSVDDGRRPTSDLRSVGAEQRELSQIGQQLIDELTSENTPPVQIEAPEPEQEGDEG